MTTCASLSLRMPTISAVEPGVLDDDLGEVLAEAVVSHATLHGQVHEWDVCELHGVVGGREDGLRQVFANLVAVDVKGGDDVDIGNVVAPQNGVHKPGNEGVFVSLLVLVHALHQGGGAIARPDYSHVDLGHSPTS